MLAKTLVPPLASVLGWPATRFGGTAGKLARGNAMRNPTRTASTASALMIGLALVTLVSVLAAGLKSTFESSVNQLFKADYALTATNNFSPISIASAEALRRVPGVRVVSGVRAGSGRAFGGKINVSGVSPDISKVIDVKWQHGSPACPANSARAARSSPRNTPKNFTCTSARRSPSRRRPESVMHLQLRGIFAPPKGGSPYGDVTISTQRFDAEYQNPQNVFTFVNIAGGVTAANTHRLEAALAGFPDAKIQTESQFKASQEQGIDTLLNLLYVLLSLSIIVSLFGIVNTLVLTVFERTRELGMLRAVGMTRRQLRRMIRHESIVTALIGAALGIPVGIVLALMVGQAIEYPAFTIPVGTLVVFVIAAILAGLLAAIFPARRAARLNVLRGAAVRVGCRWARRRPSCREHGPRRTSRATPSSSRPPGISSRSSTARARGSRAGCSEALARARAFAERYAGTLGELDGAGLGRGDARAGGDPRARRPRRQLRGAALLHRHRRPSERRAAAEGPGAARRRSRRRCCSSSSSGRRSPTSAPRSCSPTRGSTSAATTCATRAATASTC